MILINPVLDLVAFKFPKLPRFEVMMKTIIWCHRKCFRFMSPDIEAVNLGGPVEAIQVAGALFKSTSVEEVNYIRVRTPAQRSITRMAPPHRGGFAMTPNVINEDGKWVTENDNSDSSLFSENEVFDNGNDILKR